MKADELRPGQVVLFRRKIKSNIYHNLVVGPVYDVHKNAVEIVTNINTDRESIFRMYFSDWNFTYLHEVEHSHTPEQAEQIRSGKI